MAVVLPYVWKKSASILCYFNRKTRTLYAVVTAKPKGNPTKCLVDRTAKALTTYIMMSMIN